MTEVLLAEIGRKPIDDKQFDRESHSLAAGLALGYITLAQGGSAVGLADIQIEDRLTAYILGRSPGAVDSSHKSNRPSNISTSTKSSLVLEGTQLLFEITSNSTFAFQVAVSM
jgi:hypothetical protein